MGKEGSTKNLQGPRGGLFCDLRGGSMENERQYLKVGLQKKTAKMVDRGVQRNIFTMLGGVYEKKDMLIWEEGQGNFFDSWRGVYEIF